MFKRSKAGELTLRGIPVSGGVCRGKVFVLGGGLEPLPHRKIGPDDVAGEIARLETALVRTRNQIVEIQRRVSEAMGASDAGIFEAHLLVLEDPTLIDEVTRAISEDHLGTEYAFQQVAARYAETLGAIDDEYLRERVADMRYVTARVLANLLGRTEEPADLRHLKEPCILVSHDLSPSTTAQLERRLVLGFVTDIGSKTSHTAIMARSMQIPAVVGLRDASRLLQTGQDVLLDGYHGLLVLTCVIAI